MIFISAAIFGVFLFLSYYMQGTLGYSQVRTGLGFLPFTFGIVTSSFGDSVVMDDRASMVEALHERVLAVLGETPPPHATAGRDDAPEHADVAAPVASGAQLRLL